MQPLATGNPDIQAKQRDAFTEGSAHSRRENLILSPVDAIYLMAHPHIYIYIYIYILYIYIGG